MAGWTDQNIPDQTGRVIVITGASSGIGFEAAKALAQNGAEVVLAVRDVQKGEKVLAMIRALTPAARVSVMRLDVADLASVREFSSVVQQELPRIDVLLNNAGLGLMPERQVTVDGFELQLGTNHLGHFALTGLLAPVLLRAPAPRVVTIASIAHARGRMDFGDLQMEHLYTGRKAYNRSKLANLEFALELARQAAAQNSPLLSIAAHPGLSNTGFIPASGIPAMTVAIGLLATRILGHSARNGAWPGLYAATMNDVKNGDYWGPNGIAELRGTPALAVVKPHAQRREDWARLWRISEELTGVSYPPLTRAVVN